MVQSEKYVYLILEYVSGGELYDIIEREGKLDENKACVIFSQILQAVQYFHSKKVSHRDLKLENILIDEHLKPKISDFGLSNFMKDGEFLRTSCGSPNYAAPEIISNSKYCGSEVDVWSLGVILYAMVCGSLPFDEPTLPSLYGKIKNGVFKVPYHCSAELVDLLRRCFEVDSMRRITVDEILKHRWVERYRILSCSKIQDLKAGIDESIFYSLLGSQQFISLTDQTQNLKEKILTRKNFDVFTTSYELLVDSKHYSNNIVDRPSNLFSGFAFPYRKYESPSDWAFGFVVEMNSEEMVEVLFTVLKDCKFEWKIIEKFRIRVRSERKLQRLRENDNIIGTGKELKFEISLFLHEDRTRFDFRRIAGHYLVFCDQFEVIRKSLVAKWI